MLLRNVPDICDDLDVLVALKPFSSFVLSVDHIPWQSFTAGYVGLMRVMLSQQISYAVADGLWFKLCDFAGREDCITPAWFMQQDTTVLKAFGFSRQKYRYGLALSEAVLGEDFYPNALDSLSDENVIEAVCELLGFGRWSAQIYLLLCLQRRNVLPEKDLAVDRTLMQVFLFV